MKSQGNSRFGSAPQQKILGALFAGAVLGTSLISCGTNSASKEELPATADFPAYALSTPLVTVNAGSNTGAATNAELLSARLYPGVYTQGPSGQMIPNTDLVTTQVLPGLQRQVVYSINPTATFSDGTPITCTDFLVSYTAGKLPELFGSHLPLLAEVAGMDCVPGARKFSITFLEGFGDRWRNIFSAGQVLPAHIIAKNAGLSIEELGEVLVSGDPARLTEVAKAWQSSFLLHPGTDEGMVTSGPYLIAEVGSHGEVILVRNDNYYGDPAQLPKIVVWPGTTDISALAKHNTLLAADMSNNGTEWVNRDDPKNNFVVERRNGSMTDTLFLRTSGVFETAEARRAFAACIDHHKVAAASAEIAATEPQLTVVHVVPPDDPKGAKLADITDPHIGQNPDIARQLAGQEIRVGYITPNPRYEHMLSAISKSCAELGITVKDMSGAHGGDLTEIANFDGQLDAIIKPVSPTNEYGNLRVTDNAVLQLRDAEAWLWEQATTIPLTAQPRTFVIDRRASNLSVYTGLAGIGWNIDRWQASEDKK
ncbi:ABC transporter substrate-binding protein [Corynebacterium caspium]|uniref:ABC transporter substrate-binding protein n=1 Tax=Corynebacterium caspium TaxID=234828 RepID=UPI00036D9CB9|nr:ABC transporter substrate-binding protein [Corynebacterium caspium]WKD59180.1 Bacterial extracellular solute-binding protein, family 5 [Corynebacterium caspium DSM 44850]